MTRVEELKQEIEELSLEERVELMTWLHRWTDDDWDRQMKEDAESGRMDVLLSEVDEAIKNDQLLDMP